MASAEDREREDRVGEAADLIDIHCHLLPAVDDGCRDLTQTLVCVTALRLSGFAGAVCTPHVFDRLYPRNTPERIARCVAGLTAELEERRVRYPLWPGGEVRLSAGTRDWLETQGVPTLGPGRCVLIDWWGADWPAYCDDVCRYLTDHGYQPILAHPERMGLDEAELLTLLDDLQHRGVWLQGNLNSFSGGEGPEARALARTLMRDGRYAVLASDTHGPESIGGRRIGMRMIREEFGDAAIRELMSAAPRRILEWNPDLA